MGTPSTTAGPSAPPTDGSDDLLLLPRIQGPQPRVQCWRPREGGQTFDQQRGDGVLDGERRASGGEGGGDDGAGPQVHGPVPGLPGGGGQPVSLELLSSACCLLSPCHLKDLLSKSHLCPESSEVR